MKYNPFLLFILLTGIVLGMCTCNKKEDFPSEKIENYTNLQAGKYIHYKLDSTVYTNFDRIQTVRRYQAKDVIDALITDSIGYRVWRVIRYIRDSASNSEADWKPATTYSIAKLTTSLEVTEENQRYVKLKLPVINDYMWKGNSYIDPESFDASISIGSWEYTYANIAAPFTFDDGRTIDSTITVNHINEVLGNPSNPFTYTTKNYSQEVYGKNIGLVYKEYFHSEYQTFYSTLNCYFVKCANNKCDTLTCPVNDQPCEDSKIALGYTKYCRDSILNDYYYTPSSYGIKLQMIDHN